MRTMKFMGITSFYCLLTAAVTMGQWAQTGFSDSLSVRALLAEGSEVFVGCGRMMPLPVIATRWSAEATNLPAIASAGRTHQVAGTEFGAGVFMSTDNGTTWNAAGLRDTSVMALAAVGNDLIASALLGGVYISSDGGGSWRRADSGLGSAEVLCFAVGPGATGGSNLYAGTYGDGVYVSRDTGSTWDRIDTGLGGTKCITALDADGPDLFASEWMGSLPIDGIHNGLYRSTDYGATWSVADTIFSNLPVVQCIATVGNEVMAGMTVGLYESSDGGLSWSRADSSNKLYSSIDVVGRNILAGTSFGVCRSTDNGYTWTSVGTGMRDSTSVGLLAVSATEAFALQGGVTPFPGVIEGSLGPVWVRPLSELTPVKEPVPAVPKHYFLSQSYPNPFNPSTVICYRLSAVSEVTVKVYDILGRAVETLVNGRQDAGNHSITFDGSGLASGVYFYRLQTPDYTQTMKMILLK